MSGDAERMGQGKMDAATQDTMASQMHQSAGCHKGAEPVSAPKEHPPMSPLPHFSSSHTPPLQKGPFKRHGWTIRDSPSQSGSDCCSPAAVSAFPKSSSTSSSCTGSSRCGSSIHSPLWSAHTMGSSGGSSNTSSANSPASQRRSDGPRTLPRSSSTETHRTGGTTAGARPWKGRAHAMVHGAPPQSLTMPAQRGAPVHSEGYERAMELRRKKRAARQQDRLHRRLSLLAMSPAAGTAAADVAFLCLSPRGTALGAPEAQEPAAAGGSGREQGRDAAVPPRVCPWCASLLCVCPSDGLAGGGSATAEAEWVFPELPCTPGDQEAPRTRSERGRGRETPSTCWASHGFWGVEGLSVGEGDSAGQLAAWKARAERQCQAGGTGQGCCQGGRFPHSLQALCLEQGRLRLEKGAAAAHAAASGAEGGVNRASDLAREASASAAAALGNHSAAASAAQAAKRAAAAAVAAAVHAAEAAAAALTEASEEQEREWIGGGRSGRNASAKAPLPHVTKHQAPFRSNSQVRRSPSAGSAEGRSQRSRQGRSTCPKERQETAAPSHRQEADDGKLASQQGSRGRLRRTKTVAAGAESQWMLRIAQSFSKPQVVAPVKTQPVAPKQTKGASVKKGRSKSAPKRRTQESPPPPAMQPLKRALQPEEDKLWAPRETGDTAAVADKATQGGAQCTVVDGTQDLQPGMVILPRRRSSDGGGSDVDRTLGVAAGASAFDEPVAAPIAGITRLPLQQTASAPCGQGYGMAGAAASMLSLAPGDALAWSWNDECVLEQAPQRSHSEHSLPGATWQPIPAAPHHYAMKCGDHLIVTCSTPPALSAASKALQGTFGVPVAPGVPLQGDVLAGTSTAGDEWMETPADGAPMAADMSPRARRANTLPGTFPAAVPQRGEGEEWGTQRSTSLAEEDFAVLEHRFRVFLDSENQGVKVVEGLSAASSLEAQAGAREMHHRPNVAVMRRLAEPVLRSSRASWLQGILEHPEAHGQAHDWAQDAEAAFAVFSGTGFSGRDLVAEEAATWHAHKASFSEWVKEGESQAQALIHSNLAGYSSHDIAKLVAAGKLPQGMEPLEYQSYLEAKQHNKSSSFSDWVHSSRR